MKKTIMIQLFLLICIILSYDIENNIYFIYDNEYNPISGDSSNSIEKIDQIGTQLTFEIAYNFDPVKTIQELEKKHGKISDITVDEHLNRFNKIYYDFIQSKKFELLRKSNLNFTENSMRSELPQLVIISDKIIQNSNQLDYEHKLLAKHPLVDRLIVSPLYSRPPIQIEDPGGGGVPSDPYDIYYIKQTVNDSLLYSGTGIKIGVLEAAWGNEYSIVDPSIQNFNFGDVIQDPNLTVSNYNFHATTVAGISSGHNGIAKNSLVYSTSFKQSGLNPYNITQALNWLNKNSSFINDNINVDIINMSFSSPTEIDILRNIGYLNRKIMIAGSGNKHLVPIEYPAAYANVFTVGATTPSGDELWNNNNDVGIGSAYINNSNLINKPNIVAPGMINLRNFPSGIDFVQGTSFSTPIVTGAIAKLIESRPVLKMFPELVYALLMTTSNQNIISNIDQQYTMNVGNKTGSGMLDISKLINNRLNTHTFNSDNFTNGKYIFNLYIDNPTNQSLHFNIAAFWLEKYENNNYKLSNYDLRVNIDENVIISNSTTNNFEYVKTVTNHNGEITVIIDSTYFSGVNTDLIGLAWSFY